MRPTAIVGRSHREDERGLVLIIVIVILLLASVLSVFAVNVLTFEQRTSGNDTRTKLVQQVAESALTQGAERILGDASLLGTGLGSTWTLCQAGDETFPCGAVPAARRATMWRYNNAAATDRLGDGTVDAIDNRALPLTQTFTRVNDSSATATDGFAVNFAVGVVMCRLAPQAIGTAPSCSTNVGEVIRTHAFTTVAVAAMPGEGARATATKTFATNNTFGLSADQPPIMASGAIDIRGNLQVVTSPNGGGPGVPISVWTRRELDSGGTPDTCYADEFFRLGAKNNSVPTLYPVGAPSNEQTLTCDDCSCSGGQITEVQGNGAGASCSGGSDILTGGGDCSVNEPVRDNEFPCDMFKHVFGVAAWSNVTADGADVEFCESQIPVEDPKDATKEIGTDQWYLAEKANWIIKGDKSFDSRFSSDPRVITCADVTTKSGLIWDRTGACGDSKSIGTPAKPVLLVSDSYGQLPAFQNLKLFGVLFVRSTGCDGPFAPRSPECTIPATTGGDAELRFNAGTVIYGSVIVQGEVEKANGTAAVVYDSKVLGNLTTQLSTPDVYGLPGSWSDTVRY